MFTMIGTLLLGLLKWWAEARAAKRLDDEEFLEHIRAHQIRRRNAGKAAVDADNALEKAQKELDQERNPKIK